MTLTNLGKWLSAVTLLSVQAASVLGGTVDLGAVEVTNVGHSFFNPNGSESGEPLKPCTVADLLIDQGQASGGGATLPAVTIDWDTNAQFRLTLSAPAGKKFLVKVPANGAVAFSGWLRWHSAEGGAFAETGPVAVSLTGLEGTAPEIFGSAVLADTHSFFGVESLGSTPIAEDLGFTSLTLVGTVAPQATGAGPDSFALHFSSRLSLFYTTSATNDPGPFVSLVPLNYPVGCRLFILPAARTHGYGAGAGMVQVGGHGGCPWTVSNSNSWVTILSPTNSGGTAGVYYALSQNTSQYSRAGIVDIAGQQFAITQIGQVACNYTVTPASRLHGAGGEAGSIRVSTASGCGWAVGNSNSWIALTVNAFNRGTGTVEYTVAPNMSAAPRSGNINVAGQRISISQEGLSTPPESDPVILNAGQSFTYTFAALPLFLENDPPTGRRAFWVANMEPSTNTARRRVQVEMFESSTTEIPLAVRDYDSAVEGPPFDAFICAPAQAAWQDLQGAVRITVLEGTMQLNDMAIHSWLQASNTYNHYFALIRAVREEPAVTIAGQTNGAITVTFTGVLQTATDANGPYVDVPGNPLGTYTIPAEIVHTQPYFRTRRK